MLPPPVTCNKCDALVHHLCQIIWKNKHSYEPPGCSLHHIYYQELVTAGRGKMTGRSSVASSTSSAVVAKAAARVVQQHYVMNNSTPALSPMDAPLLKVCHNICHTSPADSTLTPVNNLPQPQVLNTAAPELFPVGQGYFPDNDTVDNAIAKELDEIMYDVDHDEKHCGNFLDNQDNEDNLGLRKHRLNGWRMRHDPMFFYQLLFSFCAPSDSGVLDDHWMPFYSNVFVFTNMYAMWKGAGSGYRHEFSLVSIPKLVHWAAVPLWNEALDGKAATLFHRWKEHDPQYDPVIAENITIQQWQQIKHYFKLSMGIEEKKRDEDGYNPCAKYDYIYCCLVHSMNYATKHADLDCTIDKTTWGFSGCFRDAGGRLMNKPKSKDNVVSSFHMHS
jgi:hypothetical protein